MKGFNEIKTARAGLITAVCGAATCALFSVLAIQEQSLLLLTGAAAGAFYGKVGFLRYKKGDE
ncbi:hypothetical protein AN189_00205 [Loktanella sp. 3ANDIMAR09]|uniref:hypothetical protein n=1 Tax=Loktanella sp. 3ANDIMAR09 TaxID=1225657 RepID=UPI0006F2013E|nr:hypothetical protein [Loktanella sp. 3ANDIMAR09]KQI69878.1 hypothetical protein AN189_00205 [Loktanella sp. 3ANDIMAR09]